MNTGVIFVLCLTMVNLQLFSDWLLYVFNYFTCKGWEFQRFQIYVINILCEDVSISAIWLMLWFKMADLQLFSDWLLYVFYYIICKKWKFQLFHKKLIKILFTDLSRFLHSLCDSKCPPSLYVYWSVRQNQRTRRTTYWTILAKLLIGSV